MSRSRVSASDPSANVPAEPAIPGTADEGLVKLLHLVHLHTGITMTSAKSALLRTRLLPRMRELGLATFSEYAARVSARPDEVESFINRVTTNETLFFRTPRVWEHLEREVFPAWIAGGFERPRRIWSAAAATGEEAYSLSMIACEFRARSPSFEVRIDASDISTRALADAERAEYDGRNLADLRASHPGRFTKHFEGRPTDPTRSVRVDIRSNVNFFVHSLFDRPRETAVYDLILLRNVLIYFNDADIAKVIANVTAALRPGGTLVIGESESLSRFETSVEYVAPYIYRLPGFREGNAA